MWGAVWWYYINSTYQGETPLAGFYFQGTEPQEFYPPHPIFVYETNPYETGLKNNILNKFSLSFKFKKFYLRSVFAIGK